MGLLVGIVIGTISYIGFKNTGSPTLFRLSIAFFAIGIGFGILAIGFIIDDFIFETGDINAGSQCLALHHKLLGTGLLLSLTRSKLSFQNQGT